MSGIDARRPSARTRAWRWALALAGAAALLAGCGGDEESLQSGGDANAGASGGDMLPAADVARVLSAQREIAACRDGGDARGVDGAVSTLIAVYRDGPDRIYQFGSSERLGRPMRDVLDEASEGLDACRDPAARARIERALAQDDAG
ncbi:hypothetical protein [Conexibacter arvalis]|uniref:Lipoprotein n=1 Tax=Conexibacter arvalis TaxID=912552 RepID=A0A840I8L4_9ACTN|nr:hypothetical protein [Conexibacter arvalis]MBB4660611.1 hypothetical protein [Conexibacter arvalis]